MPVNRRRLRLLTEKLLRCERAPEDVEVSILLTDDEGIRILNRDYRGLDHPTDVLAFPQSEGGEACPPAAGSRVIGDVVVSVDTARRQAEQHGHGLDKEIDLLLAHGLLHLLGYDHAEPGGEREMFARQQRYCGIAVSGQGCPET